MKWLLRGSFPLGRVIGVLDYLEAHHAPCPRCGYDLHKLPEAICPECGTGVALASDAGYGDSRRAALLYLALVIGVLPLSAFNENWLLVALLGVMLVSAAYAGVLLILRL